MPYVAQVEMYGRIEIDPLRNAGCPIELKNPYKKKNQGACVG